MTILISLFFFFFSISAKIENWIYKLSFCFSISILFPTFPTPIPRIHTPIPCIATLILRIPTSTSCIPTQIPCILTYIVCISKPISRIPLIPFSDSPSRLLQEALSLWPLWKRIAIFFCFILYWNIFCKLFFIHRSIISYTPHIHQIAFTSDMCQVNGWEMLSLQLLFRIFLTKGVWLDLAMAMKKKIIIL